MKRPTKNVQWSHLRALCSWRETGLRSREGRGEGSSTFAAVNEAMFILCKEELREPSEYRSVVSYAPWLTSAGRTFPFCRDNRMYLYRMFRKLEETSRISSPTASIVQIKKLRSWVINPPKEEKFIKAGQETASLRILLWHHTILWVPSPWLFVILYNDYRILYNECIFSKTY